MANIVLIMGESGTGKSTSIKTLNPAETFVINILDKPLPFKGYKNNYVRCSKENPMGNYFSGDNAEKIKDYIIGVSNRMPHIKTIIIDDFQYLMANEFMRRAKEKSFEKFTEIAQNAWSCILQAQSAREDLDVFILTHNEYSSDGVYKCKTIGKMLDEKIVLEGMFTVVLHSVVYDRKYRFITQHDGAHIAKSPSGMFENITIDNDLSYVKEKMKEYFEGE